jgi:hypothetical protein
VKKELSNIRWGNVAARFACSLILVFGALSAVQIGSATTLPSIVIQILSNRSDLISGGDALVQVTAPTNATSVQMLLNGADVTAQFSRTGTGIYLGLVNGLVVGNNTLTAQATGATSATTTIVNHPQGGPVFAGPQLQPWTCQAGAVDSQCNQAPTYSWLYMSTNTSLSGFQSYNPASPATDIATTTSDQGVKVPFIVRIETGYQDRDQYQIAVLYQPSLPWSAIAPQPQFNHKLVIAHGQACAGAYESGTAPSVTSFNPILEDGLNIGSADNLSYALGKGFAVLSTALDNSGHNCNVVTQAESLMMAKEHLIEAYGPLRYSIGTGCSGGSLAQQWIANAYPGIYQGILPTCSFPDAWSSATQVSDYDLMLNYFNSMSFITQQVLWPLSKQAAVEGNASTLDATETVPDFFPNIVPTNLCAGVSSTQIYDPITNPGGVRCGFNDIAINVFGPRPSSSWSAAERAAGRGFAGFPFDNTGVQYGLSALQAGTISPWQFLALNANIGGLTIDKVPTSQRSVADQPALAYAYRSGMINEANNLGSTAIIDCRGPDPGMAHDAYRAFALRARLDRANGNHANQLIWEGPFLMVADTQCNLNSLIAMDSWLAEVEKDTSSRTLADKLTADRPSNVSDECWNGAGTLLSNQLCGTSVVPIYGTPRTVAGDSITTDANKCQLKALNRSDNYGPVAFTNAQWAQMQTIFPTGVCDYTKTAVSLQPTVPWLTYADGAGSVIYGGAALPAAPTNSGSGWASPAFQPFE